MLNYKNNFYVNDSVKNLEAAATAQFEFMKNLLFQTFHV